MGIISIICIILFSYFICYNRSKIKLRTVVSSFLLLILVSVFVSVSNIGVNLVSYLANVIDIVLQQGQIGAKFLFGDLANSGFIFAITVLTNIVFLGALFSLLYYLKIMQIINIALSYILCKLLKITKPEGLSAAVNLFLGPGDTHLALKPLLPHVSRSEMFAIMVCGFSAVAGSVLGGYVAIGMKAEYLISAILMTIPGSIFIAKLIYPEVDNIKDLTNVKLTKKVLNEEKVSNIIEAISIGTFSGFKVAVAIGIMLVSFISLISLLNVILESIGNLIHVSNFNLQTIMGYIFAPVAYIMGVPSKDTMIAGYLIAQKTFTNEFVAFLELKKNMDNLDVKTQIIMTFALCGFANIGTIGIFIGSLQGLVPERVKECSKMAFKAILGAILVNLLNGTIAGLIFDLKHAFNLN